MNDEIVVGRPVQRHRESAPVMGGDASSRALLYIEDNVATVHVITAMLLRRPRVTVVQAVTGAEGIRLAQEMIPDLILLDLSLPDIGGDQVLRAVLSDPRTRSIPVVILSADATATQFDRLLRLGARAYLTKPIQMATLLNTVDTHIEPSALGLPTHAAPGHAPLAP